MVLVERQGKTVRPRLIALVSSCHVIAGLLLVPHPITSPLGLEAQALHGHEILFSDSETYTNDLDI